MKKQKSRAGTVVSFDDIVGGHLVPHRIYRVPRNLFPAVLVAVNATDLWIESYRPLDSGLINVFANNPAIGKTVRFSFNEHGGAIDVIGVPLCRLLALADCINPDGSRPYPVDYEHMSEICASN